MPRKIPYRDATEVYVTEEGQVAIQQSNPLGDDAIVCLDPADIPTVVRWLEQCAALAQQVREKNESTSEEGKPVIPPAPGLKSI